MGRIVTLLAVKKSIYQINVEQMKLSIVTINYNNAEGLRKTLASVASQTYHDIEHIIIDGGSTDGSVDVIREYESLNRSSIHPLTITWVSERDNGIYHAMNKGIKRSSGEYVFILNSGDALASDDVVERMVGVLKELENEGVRELEKRVPILMGNIVHVYGEGRKEKERKRAKMNALIPRPVDASMLTFYRGTIPQDAAFVRRDLFKKYGYFDETMKICADWKLYLDMIALGGVVPMYVDIDVVIFDMSGVSNTNNERRLAERRAYLEKVLPAAVLKDYDAYAFLIHQYQRLKKHHLWGFVRFLERVLFKLEKWGILNV